MLPCFLAGPDTPFVGEPALGEVNTGKVTEEPGPPYCQTAELHLALKPTP